MSTYGFLAPVVNLDMTTESLDSRITITRALNTATRVNSSGLVEVVNANLPRFDYTLNTGGTCKGLLVEESRINICRQSQDLNTTWTKNSAGVTPDAAISPDGTQNADLLSFTGGAFQTLYQDITVTSGQVYTLSFYAKAATVGNTPFRVWIAQVGGSATVITPTQEWVRYTITGTAPDTSVRTTFGVMATGAAVDVYIWGVQLELGAYATSYIPTTTVSVTRNADVVTITGGDFSGFWQAGRGGVIAEALPSVVSGTRPVVQFDDGTTNEVIAVRGNTTNPELYIVDGGVDQAQIDAGTIAANTSYVFRGWWDSNDCKAKVDSGAVVADTSATMPTVTQMRIGCDGTNYLNGHVATIRYYDRFCDRIYTRRKSKAIFQIM